jgi:hypothetical protein
MSSELSYSVSENQTAGRPMTFVIDESEPRQPQPPPISDRFTGKLPNAFASRQKPESN